MITLYQRTDCPFCWKVRLALAELGLGYNSVDTRLGEKHAEVLRLSPTGTVPVLVEGDVVIWESGVMLDYLDARYARARFIPVAAVEQAAARNLHAYSDKVVGPALRELVFEKRARPEADWDWRRIRDSESRWRDCLAWLESEAGTLSAGAPGIADFALGARCGVAEAYGAGVDGDFPRLRDWFKALQDRPAWDAAYPTYFTAP
ncbi:glutathione S-transferase family protein [Pseudohalioglobus sediminis]|uniref:Glutathione S-transferase family protein n=1 Tax=Pseudohalioglobus sediminis TaxID=2606449 RepID=A0A5B0X6T2_9GAMM|nr:glutathione S-transferase family protein [Pseudohalioglobus sediminis]KAA1194177.1 glutathione S-transferase family protein [Pseudohalioglobus sediminis]